MPDKASRPQIVVRILAALGLLAIFAVCTGSVLIIYQLAKPALERREKQLRTPIGVACDGVFFSSTYGTRDSPSYAIYVPDNPAISRKGQGALFVKLNGGPPIRLRDLKPKDIEQFDYLKREVTTEEGIETIEFRERYEPNHFKFQEDRLVEAVIRYKRKDIVFCDRTGKNEFTFDTPYPLIIEALGAENCEPTYPRRW